MPILHAPILEQAGFVKSLIQPVINYVARLDGSDSITINDEVLANSVGVAVRILDQSSPRVIFSGNTQPRSYAYILNGNIICNEADEIRVDGFLSNTFPDDGDAHLVEVYSSAGFYVDRFGLSHANIFSLTGQILKFNIDNESFEVGKDLIINGTEGTVANVNGADLVEYTKADYTYTNSNDTFKYKPYQVDESQYITLLRSGQSNMQGSTNVVTTEVEYQGQNYAYNQSASNGPIIGQKELLNETISSSMANSLARIYRNKGGVQPLLMSENHAVGGRSYSQIKKGGTETNAYPKFISELTAIQQVKPTLVPAIDLGHGEADLERDWTTYKNELIAFLNDYTDDIKAINGQGYSPFMIVSQISSQQVYTSNTDAVKSPLALLDVCRVSDRHFSCGSQYWCETNGGTDYYHLNARDQIISGEYRAKVFDQVYNKGDLNTPTATIVKSASISGNVITVIFDVPKPPLKFDSSYIPAVDNQGFVYSDDSGNTITSVTISGNAVIIVLSGDAGANPDLQYAWMNGTAGINGVDGGPRGNLCDSETATSYYYPSYVMKNYALSFRFGAGYFDFT